LLFLAGIMSGAEAHFSVHGVAIAVEADGPDLLKPVQAAIAPYAAPPGDGAFRLRLRTVEQLPIVAELPEFWRGTLPGGSRVVLRCDQRRRQTQVLDKALSQVDFAQGRAEFVVLPGAERCLLEACVLPWLCDLLNDRGHYVVHAASLVPNRASTPRAVLISGPSGSGKTTTGLCLAGQGFELLADDMTFFTPAAPPALAQVWGIRLARCKVHARTIQLLPWLADLPGGDVDGDREVMVDVKSTVTPTAGMSASPGLILFLNPRNASQHQVEAVDKTPALARLVNENVRTYEKHREGSAGRAFAAMAELVRTSETFEVSLCPRLEELGALVKRLLR
jgi:hypothetical protein